MKILIDIKIKKRLKVLQIKRFNDYLNLLSKYYNINKRVQLFLTKLLYGLLT